MRKFVSKAKKGLAVLLAVLCVGAVSPMAYAADTAYTSSTTYTFEEGVLLTAFTDAPAITNIRNDFSVW